MQTLTEKCNSTIRFMQSFLSVAKTIYEDGREKISDYGYEDFDEEDTSETRDKIEKIADRLNERLEDELIVYDKFKKDMNDVIVNKDEDEVEFNLHTYRQLWRDYKDFKKLKLDTFFTKYDSLLGIAKNDHHIIKFFYLKKIYTPMYKTRAVVNYIYDELTKIAGEKKDDD